MKVQTCRCVTLASLVFVGLKIVRPLNPVVRVKVEFTSWKFASVIEFDVDTILGVALEFYKNGELSKFVSAVDGLLRME